MTEFHFLFLGGLIALAAFAMLGNAIAWKMEQRAASRDLDGIYKGSMPAHQTDPGPSIYSR